MTIQNKLTQKIAIAHFYEVDNQTIRRCLNNNNDDLKPYDRVEEFFIAKGIVVEPDDRFYNVQRDFLREKMIILEEHEQITMSFGLHDPTNNNDVIGFHLTVLGCQTAQIDSQTLTIRSSI